MLDAMRREILALAGYTEVETKELGDPWCLCPSWAFGFRWTVAPMVHKWKLSVAAFSVE
jgi:hypothetical protein